MTTVMMIPCTMMYVLVVLGLIVVAPPWVEAAPMPMMKGTAPYAQPPLTKPMRQPFFSGYHFATMLMQLE